MLAFCEQISFNVYRYIYIYIYIYTHTHTHNLHQTTDLIFIKFGTGVVNLKIFEVENFVYTILIKSTLQVQFNSSILPQTAKYYKTYFKLRKM